MKASAPAFEDPRDYDRARAILADANYTVAGTSETLEVADVFSPPASDLATFLHRTEDGTPFSTLVRLFNFAVPVTVRDAERAVKPMSLEAWADAGLLSLDRDGVRPLCRIRAMPGLWVLCELPFSPGSCRPDTHVMEIAPSTVMLAAATMRGPVGSALDLGTGCGYHALRAAVHADRVVATDVNPRAAAFTEFNARLNGIENIETAVGDRFEPVSGRQFDLILSNPPYVVSPETRLTFRDGDLPGDGFVRSLIDDVPRHLTDGGRCQMVFEWAHREGEPWADRLRSWFENTGCDVWVIRQETVDADAYASRWIRQTETRDPARVAVLHRKWMDFYEEQGIVAVSFGVLSMRRTAGRRNWFHVDESMPERVGAWGDDVERLFAAMDFLNESPDDGDLLPRSLELSSLVRMRQDLAPAKNGWQLSRMELCRTTGLCHRVGVDPWIAGLVARMDGKRPLAGLIEELAEQAHQEPAAIRGEVLEIVRHLLRMGIVELPG